MKMVKDTERPPSWDISRKCMSPLVEIKETEDEIIVTADLPFVNKENIDLTAEEKTLKIRAEMDEDICFESWGGVHRKINFNSFRRKVNLPSKVNPEKAEAKFKEGILKVSLPKDKGVKIDIE